MSRIQRDYSKRTWPCAVERGPNLGLLRDEKRLTKAEGKMLADNLAAYVRSAETRPFEGGAAILDPLEWKQPAPLIVAKNEPPKSSRDRIDDFRTLTQAAVDAVIRGLADGEAQGKKPGEWRGDEIREHLYRLELHSRNYYCTHDIQDLTHIITRAVMAYALREGK